MFSYAGHRIYELIIPCIDCQFRLVHFTETGILGSTFSWRRPCIRRYLHECMNAGFDSFIGVGYVQLMLTRKPKRKNG